MRDVQGENFIDGELLCAVLYVDIYKEQKLLVGNQDMGTKVGFVEGRVSSVWDSICLRSVMGKTWSEHVPVMVDIIHYMQGDYSDI